MRLVLPRTVVERLRNALQEGGRNEIGGLLMGEHMGGDVFRVAEITIQRAPGSVACFVRDPAEHQDQLEAFFERHGREYARFNYLGEWHSHPLFLPVPSETDLSTMQEIAADPRVGANFVVLMIARQDGRRSLQLSAAVFVAGQQPHDVYIEIDGETKRTRMGVLHWIANKIFKSV